jgi:regulator of sigma E protease
MILYVIIAIFSLVALMIFHELGHFLVARKLNVKIEEFGVGIPPKIFSKKIGETVYSLNALPIGAFVKLHGEDEKIKDERSFSEKTIIQRIMILLGGVIAFWIVAFVVLTIIALIGVPTSVGDDLYDPNAEVMITEVWPEYPAEISGIMMGDIIKEIKSGEEIITINKASEVNEFISNRLTQEIDIKIMRGEEEINITSNPNEEEMIGVNLSRITVKNYPFYEAPWQGIIMTGNITYRIASSLKDLVSGIIKKEPLPSVSYTGPVGIVGVYFVGAIKQGMVSYLTMIALLSISLAIFNLLPIPALDGGRILLLVIEKIKGSPLNQKFERNIIAISFILLVGLLIFVTISDIQNMIFKN